MNSVVQVEFKKACEVGNLETVERLFDQVKDLELYMLQMRNLVVQQGYLNILEYFYRRNVDISRIYENNNPFKIAAHKGWVDVIDFLLKIKVDINLQDVYGWTSLMIASGYGNIDIIDRLFATGQCNANIENIFGDTALFIATERGRPEIVDRLVVYGANYYHLNNDGENLLYNAVRSRNINMIQKILSLGLDVNQQDIYGRTPLMTAVNFGNKEKIKILLEHGADPNIKNNFGQKASDFTVYENIKSLLTNLVSY